jgi:methyl coenzyme M reductase beta subunit
LVHYPITDDSTEEAVIQRMIEEMRRFIGEDNNGNSISSSSSSIVINPAISAHFQLEIQTLQNASRNASKLEQIIKAKERQNEKARHVEDTQRLVTEIEMLKFVLFLVSRNNRRTI